MPAAPHRAPPTSAHSTVSTRARLKTYRSSLRATTDAGTLPRSPLAPDCRRRFTPAPSTSARPTVSTRGRDDIPRRSAPQPATALRPGQLLPTPLAPHNPLVGPMLPRRFRLRPHRSAGARGPAPLRCMTVTESQSQIPTAPSHPHAACGRGRRPAAPPLHATADASTLPTVSTRGGMIPAAPRLHATSDAGMLPTVSTRGGDDTPPLHLARQPDACELLWGALGTPPCRAPLSLDTFSPALALASPLGFASYHPPLLLGRPSRQLPPIAGSPLVGLLKTARSYRRSIPPPSLRPHMA